MKKLACLIIVIGISVAGYGRGSGRRYVASLDNSAVVKSQKAERRSLRSFANGRRYGAVTRGRGLHLFGHKGAGASRPESGLGL